MTTADNRKVIAACVEDVINRGQLDRINDLVVEDFVELDPLPGQQQGREGLKAIVAQIRAAFPDIHWVIDEVIAEGDKVASRFTWSGTHRGEFLRIPPTGKTIQVKGVVIDRLAAGKMADSRILMDNFAMLQQLGAIPTT
jgi:steroid delta-isomerase-like uncharacterized protein